MAVYVDDVRLPFGRMVMCHMWADSVDELLRMADHIGLARKWLQRPPKAAWVHFDVSLGPKAKAIEAGAHLTDRFGPFEHQALLAGDAKRLAWVEARRAGKPPQPVTCRLDGEAWIKFDTATGEILAEGRVKA